MAKQKSFQLPPKKEQGNEAPKDTDTKLQEFIVKGGKVKDEVTPSSAPANTPMLAPLEPEAFKNFNIKIVESQMAAINALREKRPKPVGQKSPGISLHNWLLEAITEKLDRDGKS